jgi:hypothetical protein
MKAKTLDQAITECAHAELAEGRSTVDRVASRVEREYGDLIDVRSRELVRKQIKDVIKRLLRDLADDEGSPEAQQALPGLKLPSAIAIRDKDGGIYYVRADQATWVELQSGLDEREQNIVRAVIKRDQYQEAVDRLRPWMEHDETCTVAEALRREGGGPPS